MLRDVYVRLCVHLKIVLRVLASVFWDLRYICVVTCYIVLVVIQVGVCRVLYIVSNCASCVFVCVVLSNLSILFLGVFTHHFISSWPMVSTTLFCSLYIVSSCFCCFDRCLCVWYLNFLTAVHFGARTVPVEGCCPLPPDSSFIAWLWCFETHQIWLIFSFRFYVFQNRSEL